MVVLDHMAWSVALVVLNLVGTLSRKKLLQVGADAKLPRLPTWALWWLLMRLPQTPVNVSSLAALRNARVSGELGVNARALM